MDSKTADLYLLAARVKNLARGDDASLTPIGEKLCNLYIHVLKDLYDFAEKYDHHPHMEEMIELIKSKEGFCRDVIELNRRKQ